MLYTNTTYDSEELNISSSKQPEGMFNLLEANII